MAAANITGSLFSFILFVYLARVLGVRAFGYLSYATTLVFYLSAFMDLGLSTYGVRESAKDISRLSEYVSNIVSFKLMIAIVLFILVVFAALIVNELIMLKILMIEAALMLFVSALATEWAFQGLEKMHMVFASFSLVPFLQLVLAYLFVRGPEDLLKFPLISFVSFLPIIAVFLRYLRFKPKIFTLDFKKIYLYLSSSVVIWAISLFAQVYNGADLLILGLYRKAEQIGYFAVARRAIGSIILLMLFLANAALPRLSATFGDKDIGKFKLATKRFLQLALMIIGLIFLPLIVFNRYIILATVGGDYLPASMPFVIMIAGAALVFFNLPFSTGLIAAGYEKDVLKQTFASACLNIAANMLLIREYGMIGAAISFVLAEALALTWILLVYRKRIGPHHTLTLS